MVQSLGHDTDFHVETPRDHSCAVQQIISHSQQRVMMSCSLVTYTTNHTGARLFYSAAASVPAAAAATSAFILPRGFHTQPSGYRRRQATSQSLKPTDDVVDRVVSTVHRHSIGKLGLRFFLWRIHYGTVLSVNSYLRCTRSVRPVVLVTVQ